MQLVLLHKGGFSLLNVRGDVLNSMVSITHKIYKHLYPMNNDDSTVLYIWTNLVLLNSVLKKYRSIFPYYMYASKGFIMI